ncbi:hypothetical protein UJ101_01815 [Flavobacteriaceae bacterium UJ101]|nr:hypothetical protein UJ101_01815 [Flavobacteriaceae bacterium UJ101]
MSRIGLFLSLLIVFSCKKEAKFEVDTDAIEVNYKLKRFENDFFSEQSLDSLRKQYPRLLPVQVSDSIFKEDRNDSVLQKLVHDVEKQYSDISNLDLELKKLIKRVKYYYPNFDVKEVITLVNNPNQNNKAIYTDSLILIPLEGYLGSDSEYYNRLDRYLKKNKNKEQILSDVAESIANYIVPSDHLDGRYINLLAYEGKKMLLKDAFLPETSDSIKIGYTQKELDWVKANEFRMWNYYLDKEMLFKSNTEFKRRFIDEAPFSKFYTDNDLEIPARVGVWQGWQMMRHYLEKNPDKKLQDVINETDAEKLYYDSKYKPKK